MSPAAIRRLRIILGEAISRLLDAPKERKQLITDPLGGEIIESRARR